MKRLCATKLFDEPSLGLSVSCQKLATWRAGKAKMLFLMALFRTEVKLGPWARLWWKKLASINMKSEAPRPPVALLPATASHSGSATSTPSSVQVDAGSALIWKSDEAVL